MNLDSEFIPTAKVCAMLGGLSKSRITAIAKRLGWQSREVYSGRRFPAKEYLAADIEAEVQRRKDTPTPGPTHQGTS